MNDEKAGRWITIQQFDEEQRAEIENDKPPRMRPEAQAAKKDVEQALREVRYA